MAKVKITGHASGSGVITVTAPNTSTDRTITLPDATATIATTTDVAARLPSITDGGNATAMTINATENICIGETPNAWNSVYKALQLGRTASIAGYTGGDIDRAWVTANGYVNTSDGNWQYINTDTASQHEQRDGKHNFFVAPSGSSGATITWTTAMAIDNSGAVTMPAQPCVIARAIRGSAIPINTVTLITLDSERADVGNNLASSTFTAPVTGKYLFTYTLYFLNIDSAANALGVQIVTSNKQYESWLSPDHIANADFFYTVSGSQIADMDVNDTLQYKAYCGGGTAQTTIHGDSQISIALIS